jgi:2,3,4,5-tetrahydropyridine-2,6-dicarboxylate N-succinyltransferase
MDKHGLRGIIESAYERRQNLNPGNVDAAVATAIESCIELLDTGEARIAERSAGRWEVRQWQKKAVLLYFRTHDNAILEAGYARFFGKVPTKGSGASSDFGPTKTL